MSVLELAWLKGGDGKLVESDGASARVSSSIPSPPGSTLEGKVEGMNGAFALKVKNCKKQPDGRFLIDGKWVNLTREQRTRVLEA
ncbi:MAG: hypothetical protein KC766_33215 [Myxococcales bacterium]|nr:hypothetical protein [Myxococcales bacterium]